MSLLRSVIRVTERSQYTCSLKYDGYSKDSFTARHRARVILSASSDGNLCIMTRNAG